MNTIYSIQCYVCSSWAIEIVNAADIKYVLNEARKAFF